MSDAVDIGTVRQMQQKTWSDFGPTKMAYERVGEEGQEALTADMLAYFDEYNVGGEGTLVLEPEYLQVVATLA
jgi:hypothetical protein